MNSSSNCSIISMCRKLGIINQWAQIFEVLLYWPPHTSYVLVYYIVFALSLALAYPLGAHYTTRYLHCMFICYFFQPLVIRKSLIAYYGHSLNLKKFYWLYQTHSTLKEKLALVDNRWVSLTYDINLLGLSFSWYKLMASDVCTCSMCRQPFNCYMLLKFIALLGVVLLDWAMQQNNINKYHNVTTHHSINYHMVDNSTQFLTLSTAWCTWLLY